MRVFFFAVPYGSWQLEISGSASPMIPMMIFNIYIYNIYHDFPSKTREAIFQKHVENGSVESLRDQEVLEMRGTNTDDCTWLNRYGL